MVKSKPSSAEEPRAASLSASSSSLSLFSIVLFPVKLVLWILLFVVTLLFVKPILWISTTRFRWVVVIPIVLPMSMVYSFFTHMRAKIFFALYGSSPAQAEEKHQAKVAAVSRVIRANASSESPKKMCTARPVWDNMSIFHSKYKQHMLQVDLNKFIDIVALDETKRTVRVEPLVNVGQLTALLIPRGWTLCILPELDDLTVGGLINGFGIESTSHQYGLFQHIVVSMDVALANGDIVHCSATENSDLFYNLPWSHGTLGFLVCAELRIRPATNFVRLTYTPFHDRAAFERAFEDAAEDRGKKYELVEALSYSRDRHVLMTGTFADEAKDARVHDIGKWYGPWFYKHVESFLEKVPEAAPKKSGRAAKTAAFVEYIPLRSYYHRHTRSLFWEMEDILPFGHHWLFRHTLGWLVRPKVGFFKLTTNGDLHEVYVNKHVDQDLLIPVKTLPRFLDHLEASVKMYPLWLCPCAIPKTPVRGLVNPDGDAKSDMYVDVGVYGIPFPARPESGDFFAPEPSLRKMEALVRELGGYQALYAITYQTRPEFYKMFDHTLYFQLRERYGAVGLMPEIFDKVSVVARGEKTALDHAKYPPHSSASSSSTSSRPRSSSKSKVDEGSTTPRGRGRRASVKKR